MAGWHHRLDGHEFEQALGDAEGQRRLACCSSWVCKELDATERLNNRNQDKAGYKHPAGGWHVKFKDNRRQEEPPFHLLLSHLSKGMSLDKKEQNQHGWEAQDG